MNIHGIKYFFSQRLMQVRYNEVTSDFKVFREGLPQDSVLSPILFHIIINDIINTLKEIPGFYVVMYGDNIVLYTTSSSFKALET